MFESFGLDHSDLASGYLWDPDPIPAKKIIKRGKWMPTFLEAVFRLPENWGELEPVEVAPEYTYELWQLFPEACKTPVDGAPHANFQRWKQLMRVELPHATQVDASPNTPEPKTVLDLGGEGGG